jgi:hypothetical protein
VVGAEGDRGSWEDQVGDLDQDLDQGLDDAFSWRLPENVSGGDCCCPDLQMGEYSRLAAGLAVDSWVAAVGDPMAYLRPLPPRSTCRRVSKMRRCPQRRAIDGRSGKTWRRVI